MHFKSIGNRELLRLHKVAFLCSRKYPADIAIKSNDWAMKQRVTGNCIISGFHSIIEKDVFHHLIKGDQPIILVLERYFKKRYPPFDIEVKDALQANRMLIISQFSEKVKRPSITTAKKRNKLVCSIADEICIAYASQGGNIESLIKKPDIRSKKIISLST